MKGHTLVQSYALPSLLLWPQGEAEGQVPHALLYRFEQKGGDHYVTTVSHREGVRAKMSFRALNEEDLLLRAAVVEDHDDEKGDEATILLGLLWDSVPPLHNLGYERLVVDLDTLYASEQVAEAIASELAGYTGETPRQSVLDLEAAIGIMNTVTEG